VAVDPRHENPVQSFTSFTDDLLKMANWLESLGIKVVAMESGFIGFQFTRFSASAVLRFISSMPEQLGKSRAVNQMCWIASGFGS
jgi:hypothetical protein